jgi:hypothetical protein
MIHVALKAVLNKPVIWNDIAAKPLGIVVTRVAGESPT